jgi:hypothetical protein
VDRLMPPELMQNRSAQKGVLSNIGDASSDLSTVMTERQLIESAAPNVASFEDRAAGLNQEFAELRECRKLVVKVQNADTEVETLDDVYVRIVRTKMIISEVSFDKKLKKRLELEDIEEIQHQVEAKIQSDRYSADNEIYQRNHCLFHYLMRRHKYSKSAYEILKQFWILLSVTGDLMTFTGQLFDREYLNPKSHKYYKYVSILTFMLRYQRLSKKPSKLWFKNVKDHDKDDYFFNNWQRLVTPVV